MLQGQHRGEPMALCGAVWRPSKARLVGTKCCAPAVRSLTASEASPSTQRNRDPAQGGRSWGAAQPHIGATMAPRGNMQRPVAIAPPPAVPPCRAAGLQLGTDLLVTSLGGGIAAPAAGAFGRISQPDHHSTQPGCTLYSIASGLMVNLSINGDTGYMTSPCLVKAPTS